MDQVMIVLSAPLEAPKLLKELDKTLDETGVEAMINSSKEFEIIIDEEDLDKAKKALSEFASDKNLEMEVIR